MFSKLHPQHQPFQFSRECQTSEEDDSRSNGGPNLAAQKPVSTGDGATIEVVRRPRGRPPGSKNKPKPPLIITREPDPSMSPFILEIPGGNDVVDALARFSRRKNTSLCVLNGSGTVGNVTLRQPSVAPVGTVTFHGRFDILSMSATFLLHAPPPPAPPSTFAVSLAGPQGQIVGGHVTGRLLAAGTVFIIAASFNNPSFHRLSSGDDAHNHSASGGGVGDAQSPPASVGGAESGQLQAESCMYSCHLPSDVIWAPTARPPF
ncbi:AT-hook motif nuclear-localized protein 17 [Vigna radiata var. radiata]|uniref:AT-hook motif nuclear-localized protein n=1 Tax=Vigna radiata var. radiata TaxID=3916 RepID=A0A1S3W0K3_VIGRR|nr:AT-hook motif nuclear-localized protein 17 [Vigna radiata var. radiata]